MKLLVLAGMLIIGTVYAEDDIITIKSRSLEKEKAGDRLLGRGPILESG